jgi:hypothetical protein
MTCNGWTGASAAALALALANDVEFISPPQMP